MVLTLSGNDFQALLLPFTLGIYLRNRSQKKVVLAPTMNMTMILFSRLTL